MDLLDLRKQGMGVREVARATGYSRNTVRKWLRRMESGDRSVRSRPRPSKLGPYRDYLLKRMGEGITNSARLYREIAAQGYTGKISILKDFLKPFRPAFPSKATMRYETAPGEQAQVDFGTLRYMDGETKKKVHVFSMVLSYSRLMYLEFVEHQDLGTLIRCHQNAFSVFGGIPRKLLYDNMKTAVVRRDENGQPEWNQGLLDFARLTGFTPTVCWPYRAQTKGKVERSIRYIKTNFWPVEFTGLEDLNQQAMAWANGVANVRIHGTTRERPVDRFKREELQPLLPRVLAEYFIDEERKVSLDGFVSYRGSRYGVPWQFAGRTALVRMAGGRIEIWLGERKLASHALAPAGTAVALPGQWAGLPTATETPKDPVPGIKVASPVVEVRSLAAYEAAAAGSGS